MSLAPITACLSFAARIFAGLALIANAGAVAAQDPSPQPGFPMPKPNHSFTDNVSELDGSLRVRTLDMSIGEGASEIEVVRTYAANMRAPRPEDTWGPYPDRFTPFGLDTSLDVGGVFIRPQYSLYYDGNYVHADVTFQGKSYIWRDVMASSDWKWLLANDGSGAALIRDAGEFNTPIHVALPDGTRLYFEFYGEHRIRGAYVSKAVFPNGETLTYSYHKGRTRGYDKDAWLLNRVQSSRGWGLKLTWNEYDPMLGGVAEGPVVTKAQTYTRACGTCAESIKETVLYNYRKVQSYLYNSNGRDTPPIYALRKVTYADGLTYEYFFGDVFGPDEYLTDGRRFGLTSIKKAGALFRSYEYKGREEFTNWISGSGPKMIVSKISDRIGPRTIIDLRGNDTFPPLSITMTDIDAKTRKFGSTPFLNPPVSEIPAHWTNTGTGWPDVTSASPVPDPWNIQYPDQRSRGTRPGVYSVIDELNREEKREYDILGNVREQILPDGMSTTYKHDLWGKVLEKTVRSADGTLSATEKWTFPVCGQFVYRSCNSPLTYTNANNRVTDYQFSTTHGGLISEKRPADPSGLRPEKTYEYQAFTGIDGALFYLPKSVTERIDATRYRTEEYEYDPANLWMLKSIVETDGTTTMRSCTTRNHRGDIVTMTPPAAGKTSC